MKKLLALVIAFTVFTTGCSSITGKPYSDAGVSHHSEMPSAWRARGKFSYRSPDVTESGNFDWRQDGDQYRLRLYGPLGMGSIRISGNPNLVRIQTAKQDISSDQPLSLLYRITGFQIPLNSMPMWLAGKPASKSPSELSYGPEGKPLSFYERGWLLDYSDFKEMDNQQIPTTINAHKDGINLRMLVYTWKADS